MALALNKNVRVTKRISAKPVPKAKTPQITLVVLALGGAAARRLIRGQSLTCYLTRPPQ
jgi:hypothetical protein